MKRQKQRGLTLIELLVSMTLGLVVIGGVISVLMANRRSYTTNEGLGQLQESARTAFELMARDIREAGGNGCDRQDARTSNLLADTSQWYQTWFGVRGVNNGDTDPAIAVGGDEGDRVAGTDSIHVQAVEENSVAVDSHDSTAANMVLNADVIPFQVNDIMLVCDMDHAAIFQATSWDSGAKTISHSNSGGTIGNCASGLGFPALCDGGAGEAYAFPQNSQIGRLQAVDWYIGNNGRDAEGGRSLYRVRVEAGEPTDPEEIVAGIIDMQIRYTVEGDANVYEANTIPGGTWANVTAVLVRLTTQTSDIGVSTDAATNQGRLQRTFNYLIALRNRVE